MRISLLIAFGMITALAAAHPGHVEPRDGAGLTQQVRTGNGPYTFTTVPGWGPMPDGKAIGPTHGGIALDKAGRVYVSTDSDRAICVFEPSGAFVKSIGPECKGVHSLIAHTEGDSEFLYGAHLAGNRVVKLDLDGRMALQIPNSATGEIQGGWGGLTGVAVAPDGSIFAAMGYGSNLIHKFDQHGKHLATFGGRGTDDAMFQTCHGVVIDTRFGDPRLLVADRENRRLVHLDLDGKPLGMHSKSLRRPCAISIHGEFAAVAELEGRVTILDKTGVPVAFLGDQPNKSFWANFGVPPDSWKEGLFTAPHGLSYDAQGNLYVQDWNASGRITKLEKAGPSQLPTWLLLGVLFVRLRRA